uniref:Uncharacterized protein n=1 Tax=Paracalanus parvus TaxID=187406 RepID=A0A0U2V7Z6_9MAXI|nr:hypothetical protein [Paracalanus parvus]
MLASALSRISAARRPMLTQVRGLKGLPQYNPAADIPMSYGAVILAITLGFSGLAMMTNPFFHSNVDKTYRTKWQE